MQVGFMMQKALGELFILKSTKPLPIIFKRASWQFCDISPVVHQNQHYRPIIQRHLCGDFTLCYITPVSTSLDLSVSEYHTYNICSFQQLMMDRLPKKFAQPIHPSTATALPPPICSERKYVTSKPKLETHVWPFPNLKTRVYRRNPVWKL